MVDHHRPPSLHLRRSRARPSPSDSAPSPGSLTVGPSSACSSSSSSDRRALTSNRPLLLSGDARSTHGYRPPRSSPAAVPDEDNRPSISTVFPEARSPLMPLIPGDVLPHEASPPSVKMVPTLEILSVVALSFNFSAPSTRSGLLYGRPCHPLATPHLSTVRSKLSATVTPADRCTSPPPTPLLHRLPL